jgi:hypothetical protein
MITRIRFYQDLADVAQSLLDPRRCRQWFSRKREAGEVFRALVETEVAEVAVRDAVEQRPEKRPASCAKVSSPSTAKSSCSTRERICTD